MLVSCLCVCVECLPALSVFHNILCIGPGDITGSVVIYVVILSASCVLVCRWCRWCRLKVY